ncbi:glyco_like_cofC, transferase 1, rSAM/selenodomain-associated [Caulobacteraceae bacterium]
MDAERRHLVIFARTPAFGVGKRRLAAGAGELATLRFQRFMVADLRRRLGRDRRWRTWLAVTPDRDALGRGDALAQGGGDLGVRLRRLLKTLPPGPVVVIGSDTPGVTPADIARAFHALGAADAVFGPAQDGGYWLIGLKRTPRRRDPFEGVRWSTAHALADTLANLDGRPVTRLRTLEDIDDVDSLQRAMKGGRYIRPEIS